MEVVGSIHRDNSLFAYSSHDPEFSYAHTLINSAYPFSENDRMSGSM